jgi:NitT/TauT family transport system permease protein
LADTYARNERTIVGASTALAFVVVWEVVVQVGRIPEVLLPAPSSIGVYFFSHLDLLWRHTQVTLYETIIGFALALVIGVTLSVAIVWSSKFEAAVYPFILTAQVVPKVALAPLVVVYLGLELQPKIFLSFLVSFFPIVVNTMLGLKSVRPELRELLATLKANRWQILFKVQLFQAVPYIIAAAQVTITLAIIGAIVGEFVAARSGLGYLIATASPQLNTQLIFSSVICLTIMGIVLFQIVTLVGRLLTPWVPRQTDGGAQLASKPTAV